MSDWAPPALIAAPFPAGGERGGGAAPGRLRATRADTIRDFGKGVRVGLRGVAGQDAPAVVRVCRPRVSSACVRGTSGGQVIGGGEAVGLTRGRQAWDGAPSRGRCGLAHRSWLCR